MAVVPSGEEKAAFADGHGRRRDVTNVMPFTAFALPRALPPFIAYAAMVLLCIPMVVAGHGCC